jgi:tRNA threonylcarbamoyladenosine biosynthesis protein TsaB
MIVLGFDTATPATAVALRLADGRTLRAYEEAPESGRPGHTTQLLGLAGTLLGQAGIMWGGLGRIAVGVGPGTFTGLRVGIATARGLSQSLGIEVASVGSLGVLAHAALRDRGLQPEGGVLAMIDARRGETFLAAYDYAAYDGAAYDVRETPAGSSRTSTGEAYLSPPVHGLLRELAPPRALAPDDLAAALAALGNGRPWLAVGDGALRFRGHLEALAVTVPEDASPLHRIDAGALCELAVSAQAGGPEMVLPDYCRRPDAEIALEQTGSEQ